MLRARKIAAAGALSALIALGPVPSLAQASGPGSGVPGMDPAVPATTPPDPLPAADASTGAEELGAPTPIPSAIETAWFGPGELSVRVDATRREALRAGVPDFDAAARALLSGRLAAGLQQRSELAVRLAPDLPAARVELARALWLEGDRPLAALGQLFQALWHAPRHLEASLWLGGSAAWALSRALLGGGLLALLVAGAFAARHAIHDLGDLLPVRLPEVGRAAVAAALWLLPALLGAGVLGLALMLALAAAAWGGPGSRRATAAALGAIWLGAFPMARLAGNALTALARDPVVSSALAVGQGAVHLDDLQRLEAAAAEDALAERALAARARRHGQLAEADARYQRLLRRAAVDPALFNNAANVRLDLGHLDSALELYGRALAERPSAAVYYNQAQAYGRAFQVEQLNQSLGRAQALDGAFVAELTRLQEGRGEGFAVDLPLPAALVWSRVLHSRAGEPLARELRAFLLPGILGEDPRAAAGLLFGAAVAGGLLAARVRSSRACALCGRRMCPRCDELSRSPELCRPCHGLRNPTETTHRERRAALIQELTLSARRRRRWARATALLLPGGAGQLAGSPLRALIGCVAFAALCAGITGAPVVDPLVLGAAAPLALGLGLAAAGLVYAAALLSCLVRLARSGLA